MAVDAAARMSVPSLYGLPEVPGLYAKNLLDRIEPASEESLALLLGPKLQPLTRVLPLSQGLSSLRRVLAAWVQ